MERRNPVIASGIAKMEGSIKSLDLRVLPPPDDVSPEEDFQTEFTKTAMNSIEGGFGGLFSRIFSTDTQYGFSLFEQVWAIEELSGFWRIEDMLYVPPWCVASWDIDIDTGLLLGAFTVDETGDKYLPREKFLHSARRFFGRNYEGEAAFRPIYYHDEAMRRTWNSGQIILERTGEGTLVLKQPENPDPKDVAAMEVVAQNWEGGKASYIQLPFGWEISWDYGGTPPDTDKQNQQHGHMISLMLEDTLSELGFTAFGARAVGQEMRTVTQRVLSGICSSICNTISQQVIYPIYRMNGWDTTRACYPHVSGFEDADRLTRIREFLTAEKPKDPLIPMQKDDEQKIRRSSGLS